MKLIPCDCMLDFVCEEASQQSQLSLIIKKLSISYVVHSDHDMLIALNNIHSTMIGIPGLESIEFKGFPK